MQANVFQHNEQASIVFEKATARTMPLMPLSRDFIFPFAFPFLLLSGDIILIVLLVLLFAFASSVAAFAVAASSTTATCAVSVAFVRTSSSHSSILRSGRCMLARQPSCSSYFSAKARSLGKSRSGRSGSSSSMTFPLRAADLLHSKATPSDDLDDGDRVADENDFSLRNLHARMSRFLETYSSQARVAVAVAGGGGHFLSTLASTPGASKVLLEGTLTYDRESYRQYVRRDLDPDTFRYASAESARYAGEAALNNALRLTAAADTQFGHVPLENMTLAMGVACASALQTKDDKKLSAKNGGVGNTNGRKGSVAFVSATRQDGAVELRADLSPEADRSRPDEDVFVAHCILTCLEYALRYTKLEEETVVHKKTAHGDEIRIVLPPAAGARHTEEMLRAAADRILSGRDDSVALLPCLRRRGYQALPVTTLPPRSVIIPGSFNPPHVGHLELANAALKASDCQVAWFELSVTNADKPSLHVDEIVRRVLGFMDLLDNDAMPAHWGILLTNAPLFVQKVGLLHPLQVSRSFSSTEPEPLHFVIGTDTLVRIMDPKYYDNSEDKMLQALYDMKCNFVVGGRLEQNKATSGGESEPEFVTGREEVKKLPDDLQHKFTLLEDFRVDISSTELRRQKALHSADGQ